MLKQVSAAKKAQGSSGKVRNTPEVRGRQGSPETAGLPSLEEEIRYGMFQPGVKEETR